METGRRRLLSPDPHQTRICTFPTEAWSSGRMVKRAKAILCLRYPLLLSRVPVLCRATSSHLLNLVNPRFDTNRSSPSLLLHTFRKIGLVIGLVFILRSYSFINHYNFLHYKRISFTFWYYLHTILYLDKMICFTNSQDTIF